MTQRSIEMVIGRLVTDEELRQASLSDPHLALSDLLERGTHLTLAVSSQQAIDLVAPAGVARHDAAAMAVKRATRVLQTGDRVRLDPSGGRVTVLERAALDESATEVSTARGSTRLES